MANLKTIQFQPTVGSNPYMQIGNIPGLRTMTGGASQIIQNELGGMPSPTETRTANAAWGAAAGLPPGTPFLENRGMRLYRGEVENRQRQGIQDLLAFLRGYSGTVSATPGQLLQYGQQQQQSSFENAMNLIAQQLAERQKQNQWVEDSRTSSGPFGGAGPGYVRRRNLYTGQEFRY
jgi:hypothetical protein